jgi:hypothetical protein
MSTLSGNDFTLYKEGSKLMSGGFSINTSNMDHIGGSSSQSSNILDHMAMPLYFYSKGGGKKNYHKYEESHPENAPVIEDNIFDKLLKMVEYKDEKEQKNQKDENNEKNKKSPRREKINKKRGTKKHIDKPLKKKKTRKNITP